MCTAATYQTRDFYMGRTLDYEFSYGEEIVITPRRFPIALRHGGGSLRVAHDHHPVAGRCGAHNLQEGEPAAEILQLALDRVGSQPVFFDLL